MIVCASAYFGYTILSKDGEVGTVKDLLFDDQSWVVRFFRIHSGLWPFRKQVLISPIAITQVDHHSKRLILHLSRKEIENSPDADDQMTVSRAMEKRHFDHFNWPYYWQGPYLWGPVQTPTELIGDGPDLAFEAELAGQREVTEQDLHLRSVREVQGYEVLADGEEAGMTKDFVVDESNWHLRDLVVDLGHWYSASHRILVSMEHLAQVSWSSQSIRIDLTRDHLRSLAPFNPHAPVNRLYEARLYDYYGRPKPWTMHADDHHPH